MQVVFAGKVELDWCGSCRGFWFDRGELVDALGIDGEIEVTRDQPASECPSCKRRGARGGVLWTSTIGGVKTMACLACGGSFVLEASLVRRRRAKVNAQFICAKCGDRYALEQACLHDERLRCARCAPPPKVKEARLPTMVERFFALFAAGK
jgi:hypothetical protein